MAQEQINQLKQKLQAQQAQFQRYKAECKQLEQFLESESNKKEEQIRKLKQQAILKEKGFAPVKAQVIQLQTQNNALKAELAQLKQKEANKKPVVDRTQQFTKKIDDLTQSNQKLISQRDSLQQKIKSFQSKSSQSQKGKSDGDYKKLEQTLSASKSKTTDLQKQVQKLKEQLKKGLSKNEDKKIQKDHKDNKDNKQQQRLRQKIQKLEKKLSQSHSQITRAEQKSIKLSKQNKQLKQKLSSAQSQKQMLSKKVKQLAHANNSFKKQQNYMNDNQQNQQQQFIEQSKQHSNVNILTNTFSALMMTKKHYSSPFLQLKNDNSIKLFKSTKNGCFEKSLGSIKYKLNQISYNQQQLIQNCAKTIIQNIERGVKNSITLFGSKKTTKKYLMANLVSKLKDFIMQKISGSDQQIQVVFIKASPDPEKKIQMIGHSKQQAEQIFNRIIQVAQKSPRKVQIKKKTQPKPKARYFKISQGSLYLQIITTSFTNIAIRQNQNINEVLNNIAYSRLPNALQPTDCYRHFILTLNPIVSLYDQCKNTLSIANCKKNVAAQSLNQYDHKSSPIKQELNDTARKKLQSIQRQSQQSQLKIRKQQQQIVFYKTKFDELELRLKNLLNTHRQQNTYLKKSPVTLSYQKMLKFVHAVQAKNPALTTQSSVNKFHGGYGNNNDQNEDQQIIQNDEGEGEGEDIL